MDPVSILKSWVEPITGPLQEMRSQVEALSSINQSSVNTFNTLVNDLTDSYLPNAFTGPGANAMSTLAGDYVTTEAGVADIEAFSGPMVEAVAASDVMVEGILEAIFTAGSEVTDTGPLEAVTATVDIAAGVQGGLDVPNDVAAVGLTGVEALALVAILVQFLGTLFFIWMTWQSTLDGLSNQHYPELPDRPKVVQPPMNRATLEDWKREFPDVPEEYIKELMKQGLDGNQIRARLKRYKQMKALQNKFPLVPMEFIYQLLAKGQLNEKEMEVALSHYAATKLSPVNMTPEQQALYNKLLADFIKEFPNIDPNFLQHLVTAKLVTGTLREDKVTSFLKDHKNDMEYIAWLYTQMANIPGAERVLRDLAGGSKESYKGSLYQMEYVLYIKTEVTELEPTEEGKHGVDIVLRDGTIIVDVKSYVWFGKSPSYNTKEGQKFAEQIKRFRKIYGPDVKIRYTFDGKGTPDGKVPDEVQRELKKADPNVDIKVWP